MTEEEKIAVVEASLEYGYGCFIRTRYSNEKVVHHCENKVEYLVYWKHNAYGPSLYCEFHRKSHCPSNQIIKAVKIDD